MNSLQRLSVLTAGHFGTTHAAGMATVGFAEAARLAEAVALRRDAGGDYGPLGVRRTPAIETFCCEVKHHGQVAGRFC
jgi:hypothetical protein